VIVHNWATNRTRTVADWAEVVRTDEELRRDLKAARIVTMWLGWHDILSACFQPDTGLDDPRCAGEASRRMEQGYDELLSEVVSLADPAKSLVRGIADVGIPTLLVSNWKTKGIFEDMKEQAYEAWRHHIYQAAARHRVTVVETYTTINGPDGDEATSAEYMQPDGLHFNKAGHRLLAQLHREVGYEYAKP
jgi:hypothetical protein